MWGDEKKEEKEAELKLQSKIKTLILKYKKTSVWREEGIRKHYLSSPSPSKVSRPVQFSFGNHGFVLSRFVLCLRDDVWAVLWERREFEDTRLKEGLVWVKLRETRLLSHERRSVRETEAATLRGRDFFELERVYEIVRDAVWGVFCFGFLFFLFFNLFLCTE